jgi:tRNA(His) guanylyltransferase
MSKSQYEYVKSYEFPHSQALPNTFLVVRVDGKSFTKFTQLHQFEKPNDLKLIALMNTAAVSVMEELQGQVLIAYGQSDEYSFLFDRKCVLYKRRLEKITSTVVSIFTASFVANWQRILGPLEMKKLPIFDGRLVQYPTINQVLDYFAWRQADCHINNLYNTCFWALVHDGVSNQDASRQLDHTDSGEMNEMLFSRYY